MGTLHQQSLFDYMIVDHVVAHDVSMLSEKCLFLPCYQPNNTQREQGDAKDKTSHGLPEDAFVFCCFNQSFKITQTVFSAWMHILKQVPNSVLWLLACNEWAIRHLYQYAAQEGIAKERIIFAERVPIETHLARHQHADLFLDTLPYNAHTTASDALWCGLPVLTCIGDTFASRVSASLLTRLGLPNLITTSMTDYIQEAIHLAKSPQALSTIKHTIQLNHSQLFNSQSFTLALETTYREIFNQFHDA
jgi:predicted O-linked N-acetylglucosamine transferase (SPINDLY family)